MFDFAALSGQLYAAVLSDTMDGLACRGARCGLLCVRWMTVWS